MKSTFYRDKSSFCEKENELSDWKGTCNYEDECYQKMEEPMDNSSFCEKEIECKKGYEWS